MASPAPNICLIFLCCSIRVSIFPEIEICNKLRFLCHTIETPWIFRISREDAYTSNFTLVLCPYEIARAFRGFQRQSKEGKIMVTSLKL